MLLVGVYSFETPLKAFGMVTGLPESYFLGFLPQNPET